MMKKYLVVITFKTWVKNTPDNGVITFYEINATDDYYARHQAYECFEQDYISMPWIKKYMKQFNAFLEDTCAPEAVEIN